MKFLIPLLLLLAFPWDSPSFAATLEKSVELYRWIDFEIKAPNAPSGTARWDVDGSCTWTHDSGTTRTSTVWFTGSADVFAFRFGSSLAGRWRGRTKSTLPNLNNLEFEATVTPSINPNRTGWSGQLKNNPRAWAHQHGPDGQLRKRTPILVMMPDVRDWHNDHAKLRSFIKEFSESHGFNGGHISTIGRGWFEAESNGNLKEAPLTPDVRTFAALETAASEWAERGGWLHLWMWGKRETGDFAELPGGYSGALSKRINRYIAARLGPVPGWSMGIGWDVEFWADERKLKWWLDDLIPQFGGWHHWIGFRYSDSDIGQGHDPEPANKGEYLERGIKWSTLRPANEQYVGWEHWSPETTNQEIARAADVFPNRPMLSEDRFRSRENGWRQKDLPTDAALLTEIPRWAKHGIGAIYGRLEPGNSGSVPWPNKAEIKRIIEESRE